MRNRLLTLSIILIAATLGCNSDNTSQNLHAGYHALDQKQYDEAIARADQQLKQSPTGAGSAEALYLKGRALEDQTSAISQSPQQARQNLMQARDCYNEALGQNPSPVLQGRIHAGLANISYWQEDYSNAMQQWQAGYSMIPEASTKSFILYRIGLCQQRLGRFSEADQTFATVQQQYPGTDAAKRARDHQGFKAFMVQLATFANASTAESAIATVRRQGVIPSKSVNAQGNTIVSVGPVPNYARAKATKDRFVGLYPQAVIVP